MRQKSPLKSIYQQLNEIQVNYVHSSKRQLQPIYDSKILNNWDSISVDLKKTVLSLAIIEIIDKGFDDGDKDENTYYLLKDVLSYFDSENNNALSHTIPEHIRLDSNNSEYELFINMIGHHYDILYSYS